jgi:hypothetical protein
VQIVYPTGKYQNRYQGEISRGDIKGISGTSDISYILMFYWFEPVLYLDPVSNLDFQKPQKGLDTL